MMSIQLGLPPQTHPSHFRRGSLACICVRNRIRVRLYSRQTRKGDLFLVYTRVETYMHVHAVVLLFLRRAENWSVER
jgi:hypothetical protein